MVLSALWVSLGLLLGALGSLLGVYWAPMGCSWGLLGASWAALKNFGGLGGVDFGASRGLSWPLLWFLSASRPFLSPLRSSWGRFGAPQLTFRASKTRFLDLSTHSTQAVDSLRRSTHSTSAQDVILSNPSGRRMGKPESKRAREQESKRAREHESKRAKIQGRRGSAGAPKGLQSAAS